MEAFISAGSEYGKRYGVQGQGSGRMPGYGRMLTEEQIEHASIGTPRLQRRSMTVLIECYAKALTGVEDVLDTMAKEVEAALARGAGDRDWQVRQAAEGDAVFRRGRCRRTPVGVLLQPPTQ